MALEKPLLEKKQEQVVPLTNKQKDKLKKAMNAHLAHLSAEISFRVARIKRENQDRENKNDQKMLDDNITVEIDQPNGYTAKAFIQTSDKTSQKQLLEIQVTQNQTLNEVLKSVIKCAYNKTYSEDDLSTITIGDEPAPTGCWSVFVQACMWTGLILEASYFAFTLANLSKSLLGEDIVFGSTISDDVPGILPGLGITNPSATNAWRASIMAFAIGLSVLDLGANLGVVTPKKSTQEVFDLWSSATWMLIPLSLNMISYIYGGFGNFEGINNFTELASGIDTDAWYYVFFPLFQIVSLCAAAGYYSGFHAEKVSWLMGFFSKGESKKFWDFGAKLSEDARGPAALHSLSLLCYALKDIAILGMIRCIAFAYLGQDQMEMIGETYGLDQKSAVFKNAATALRWIGGTSTISQVLTVYTKGIINSLYTQEEEKEETRQEAAEEKKESQALTNLEKFKNFKTACQYKKSCSSRMTQAITGLSTWLGFSVLANFFFMGGAEALWDNPTSQSAVALYVASAILTPTIYWAAKWKEHENEVAVFTKTQSIQENIAKLPLYSKKKISYTDILCEIRATADEANDPQEKMIRAHRQSLKAVNKSMQALIVQWQQLKTIIANPENDNLLGEHTTEALNGLEKSYTNSRSTRKPSSLEKFSMNYGSSLMAFGTTLARQLVLFHFVASMTAKISLFKDRSYTDNFVVTLALIVHNTMGTFLMYYDSLSTNAQCIEEDFHDTYKIIDNLKKDGQLNCLTAPLAKLSLWWRTPSACSLRRQAEGDTPLGASVLPPKKESIPL